MNPQDFAVNPQAALDDLYTAHEHLRVAYEALRKASYHLHTESTEWSSVFDARSKANRLYNEVVGIINQIQEATKTGVG
jgi:hypothetical protein